MRKDASDIGGRQRIAPNIAKAAEKLVEQFNRYCPFLDLCGNGKQGLSEIVLIWQAYPWHMTLTFLLEG